MSDVVDLTEARKRRLSSFDIGVAADEVAMAVDHKATGLFVLCTYPDGELTWKVFGEIMARDAAYASVKLAKLAADEE